MISEETTVWRFLEKSGNRQNGLEVCVVLASWSDRMNLKRSFSNVSLIGGTVYGENGKHTYLLIVALLTEEKK